jgi:hypothetical protein
VGVLFVQDRVEDRLFRQARWEAAEAAFGDQRVFVAADRAVEGARFGRALVVCDRLDSSVEFLDF